MLTVNQSSRSFQRIGNTVARVDTNWVGSNEPCEDRSAIDLIPRSLISPSKSNSTGLFGWIRAKQEPSSKPPAVSSMETAVDRITPRTPLEQGNRDLMFFSVLDGHAGYATSQLLSKTLHPTLTVALAGLEAGYLPHSAGWKETIAGYLAPLSWGLTGTDTKDRFTPSNVALTLQNA